MNLADDLRYALDPVAFAAEALGLELDDWQRSVIASTGKRDLLNCSRQAGKSTTAAVLGLHEALYRPHSLTILVSPSQRQSSELFRKVTELRELLPTAPELTEDNKLSMSVKGGGRVLSLPGSEATIRGFSGATLIVEDEASRVDDNLYFSIRPMLAVKGGRLILMSTPFGRQGQPLEVAGGVVVFIDRHELKSRLCTLNGATPVERKALATVRLPHLPHFAGVLGCGLEHR